MSQNNDIATSNNNDYDNIVTTNDFLLQNETVSNNDVFNIVAVTTAASPIIKIILFTLKIYFLQRKMSKV